MPVIDLTNIFVFLVIGGTDVSYENCTKCLVEKEINKKYI